MKLGLVAAWPADSWIILKYLALYNNENLPQQISDLVAP